jgi:DNA or RNA helicases of superfamily II
METLELRDYQKEAIEKWRQRGQRGILVLPTGTGKTYIALAVIKEEIGQNGKVAVIVPTIVLAQQWQSKIYQYVGIKPSLYYTHEKGIGKITIFVVNSAYLNRHLLQYFSLVVVDEIHHLSAPTWKQIVEVIKDKKVMGLTATPENAILPIVYYMGIGLAREKKAVVNVEIRPVFAELTYGERIQYEQIDQALRDIARKLDSAKAYGDKTAIETLDRKLKIMANKRKQLMSEVKDKAIKVLEIARVHPNEKILVFTESIKGAERIAQVLNDNGIKTMTIHSQKGKATRNAILQEWGKGFRILIAVRSLDEGVDIPDVSIGIIVATGKTIRQLTQRLGRILRPAPNKEKAIMYVVLARNTYETSILWKINKVAFSR